MKVPARRVNPSGMEKSTYYFYIKKGDRRKCENYRSFSITSSTGILYG